MQVILPFCHIAILPSCYATMPTMNLFCLSLTINKPKKKESSFNFIRLHPKPHIEPLVTPPASPLVSAPPPPPPPPLPPPAAASPPSPKRCESPALQSDPATSKFTERLELPPSFYETSFSESTRELVPQPLSLQSAEHGGNISVIKEEERGAHPYLRTSKYGVVDSSRRDGCN